MVRGFFQERRGRIADILVDAVRIFERWHGWDLARSVDPMEFDDFCAIADAVKQINKAEDEARRRQRSR